MTTNKLIIPIQPERDYYCSMKFTFLKIDLERKTTYNCHAASPHPTDFEWLDKNPGQLFNNPTSVTEREMMLRNERNPSCEQNCWHAEDFGGQSPRQTQRGYIRTSPEVRRQPAQLDLTISRDCNLTCSYCCKEHSSSWTNDIINNGDYALTHGDERYKVVTIDKVLKKISQPDRYESADIQRMYQEIDMWIDKVEWFTITGGEPLLNNQLISLVAKAKNADLIDVYSGLGLSYSRFDKLTDQLAQFKNLRIVLSCENIDKFLEFNRYGIKWTDYQQKIECLKNKGIRYSFNSTLSNISLFGFLEFAKWANIDKESSINFCYTPRFLSPYVLDNKSKENLLKSLSLAVLPNGYAEQIIRSINKDPSELQIQNCREFLLEFTNRRKDLSLDIFPEHFLKWLGIK